MDVAGVEQLAQLVADAVDDGLEAQRLRRALLDAVDHRELARAPFRLRLGAARLGRALGHLGLEARGEARVGQRHGGLRREQRQQVAVGVVETAERAVDVGIEIAEQLALRDQRRDQARALVDSLRRRRARGAGARTRPARFLEPRRHGLQQRLSVFAARHARAGELEACGRVQHEQHASGAQELGGFVDQERVQLVGAAQRVHAQADVEQALERWAVSAHEPASPASAPRPAHRRGSA